MFLTVHEPGVIQSLIDRQVLSGGLLFNRDGFRIQAESLNVGEPVLLLKSQLSHGLQAYLTACSVFHELDQCYTLLQRMLLKEDDDSFVRTIEGVAQVLQQLSGDHFDLSYGYLSWKSVHDYPVIHHLIVALTVARVGRTSRDLDAAELKATICAALTMNISMLDLQSKLRSQTEPLNAAQREQIRKHPEQSASRLRLLGVEDQRWLSIVKLHHERPDGSGYPKQTELTDNSALLLGVCDSFNARMAQREYRRNFTAEEALQDLFSQADPMTSQFTSILLEEIGIYPAGSILQLESNQIGVSLLRGQNTTSPLVLIFRENGALLDETRLIDTANARHRVKTALPRRNLSQLPSLLTLLSRIS